MARGKKTSLSSIFTKTRGKRGNKSLFNAFGSAKKSKKSKSLFNAFGSTKKSKGMFNAFNSGKKGKGLFNAFGSGKKGGGLFDVFGSGKKSRNSGSIFSVIDSYGGIGGWFWNTFNPAGERSWQSQLDRGYGNNRQSYLYFVMKFDDENAVNDAFKTINYDSYQKGGDRREDRAIDREQWVLERWRDYKNSPKFREAEMNLKTLPKQQAEEYLGEVIRAEKLDDGVLYYLTDLVHKRKW